MATVADAKNDIQGFVTSGYGHTYSSAYLFVRILDINEAKSWLTDIVPQVQTAASYPKDENGEKIKPERILNIAFSMDGLSELGLSDTTLNSFPAEMQEGMAAPDRAKLIGDVDDSAPEKWVIGGPKNTPFHLLVILHAGLTPDDDTTIKTYVEDISQGIDSHGMEILHIEWGTRRGDDKEHYGFRDGIAQPKIEGINIRDADGNPYISNIIKPGEFIMGYINQYGLHASVPVVPEPEDPHDILPVMPNPGYMYLHYNDTPLKDLGKNGTYIVYRKLKQDVALFWNFLKSEAKRLDETINPERIVWLAAKFVGRYPNGNPLIPHMDELRNLDDFLFAKSDPEGLHCPFGSHIRRTNPRDVFFPTDAKVSLDTVDKHRILRRGRIYGDTPLFDLSLLDDETNLDRLSVLLDLEDDGLDRGLQFFCVNASIQMQFEFIQDSWSNNPHFNAQYQNKDPLIGDNSSSYQRDSFMHIPHEPLRIRTSPLPRFVNVLGGAYLFMPSISALKYLAR